MRPLHITYANAPALLRQLLIDDPSYEDAVYRALDAHCYHQTHDSVWYNRCVTRIREIAAGKRVIRLPRDGRTPDDHPIQLSSVGRNHATMASCRIGERTYDSGLAPYGFEAAAAEYLLRAVRKDHPTAELV